jgi:hypothetical protein
MSAPVDISQLPDAPVITGFPAYLIMGCVLFGAMWVLIRLARMPGCRQLIEEWCLDHHLRLVDMERRWFWKGPFFLSPNGTIVYYITTRDPMGQVKHFWARCGHWLFGMLAPELRIRPAD